MLACTRMWTSSPICTPCAAKPRTSIGTVLLERFSDDRTDAGGEEAQALDGRWGLPAEPRRLAGPLVERREGSVPAGRVLGHPDRL